MDGWEEVNCSSNGGEDVIWACNVSALDHYDKNPTSCGLQSKLNGGRLIVQKPVEIGGEARHRQSPAPLRNDKLIDAESPANCAPSEEDDDYPSYGLLNRRCDGMEVHLVEDETQRAVTPWDDKKLFVQEKTVPLESGTVVRGVDESLDPSLIRIHLEKKQKPRCKTIVSCDAQHSYAFVYEMDLIKISRDEVMVLRCVPVQNRLALYNDWERFAFVRHLKDGDEVECKTDEEMRRGFIEGMDLDDRGGYMYSVRFPSSFSPPPRERRVEMEQRPTRYRYYDDYEGSEHEGNMIYRVSADRLFMPRGEESRMDNRGMRPEVTPLEKQRETIIPIQLVNSSSSGSIRDDGWNNRDSFPAQRREQDEPQLQQPPRQPPLTKPRTIFTPPAANLEDRRRNGNEAYGREREVERVERTRYDQEDQWRKMHEVESRSNNDTLRREEERRRRTDSTTTSVPESDGWRVGHRCAWTNDGTVHEGTVRWIGRLRGHNSIYAGVQFDAPVGQGTGMYQGAELFKTDLNHAGFVMISTISPVLISTTSNVHPSTYQTQSHQREKSRDGGGGAGGGRMERNEPPPYSFNNISYPVANRVGNASPPMDVPLSGQGAMVPPPRYKRDAAREEAAASTSAGPSSSSSAALSSHATRPLPSLPPPYDADRPVPLRPSPPSLPKRPAMLPEDYMIESFDVDSCVEVCYKSAVRSGVIRWKGDAVNEEAGRLELSVIVELETAEAPPDGWRQSQTSGILDVPHTLSTVIVPITAIRRDRRFAKEQSPLVMSNGSGSGNGYGEGGMRVQDFGSIDSGVETVKREPWQGTEELIGRMKGIQGNRNSCYLDSMLYALFVQCAAFDDILSRRRTDKDIREYDEVLRILSTEIIWPLRKFHYVRADHMMKLRKELEKALPNIKGLTDEEKDPEEILSALFRDVFKTKPYLNLINAKTGKVESTWLYHVVVDAEEWQGSIASTQHLLERSFRKDQTKLAECPQVFIMQLPRYGTTKLFDKIVPLEKIDLTPFINNTVFACAQCQKNAAELYCHECYLMKEALYGEVSYCVDCFRSVHLREGLGDHADRPIPPPSRPSKKMTRYTFTLSGVLAIETSHYVSFVRSGQGRWLFFDSMADREGLQNGFNIPQVKECDRMGSWLSLAGYQRLRVSPSSLAPDDILTNRLLSDSYICIYTADQTASSNSTTSLLSKLTKELKISRN